VDVAQSTRSALIDRPETAQARYNVAEAQKLVQVAGSTLLPTIGLVGSAYATNAASATTPENYAEVSAEVSVPMDDGGATRSRVRSAKIEVQNQSVALAQIQQSVSLEVRQSSYNIRNAQAEVTSAQTGVTSATEALRLAQERYQAGLGTFLDVLNALAQLAVTRTNLSNASYFYQSSLAQLVRAMGGR
jgi:outer membrane protein TolC